MVKRGTVVLAPTSSGRSTRSLALIVGRWIVLVVCVVIGVGIAFFSVSQTKEYVSSAQVVVTPTRANDASGNSSGNSNSQSQVPSYVSVVASPTVTDAVVRQLNLPLSSAQLAGEISTDAPLQQTLLNIHVRDKSAARATEIVNAVANQFISYVVSIETVTKPTTTAPAGPVLKFVLLHPAVKPGSLVSSQKTLKLLVGFFGGLLVGIALVIARERISNRLRSPFDVETASRAPLLGIIPNDRRTKSNPNAFAYDTGSARSEAFRSLRANLQFVDVDEPPKIIAVTSPLGGEGKSSVALNLAVSMAEVGLRVCLVDADLREPALDKLLGLDGRVGLTSMLVGNAEFDRAIQPVTGNLWAVAAGPLPSNPGDLLASEQFRSVISELAERFDYVVLDAAASLPVADGAEVSAVAEATVVVVRASSTNREAFRRTVDALSRVTTVAGAVLNRSSGGKPRSRGRGPDRTPPASRHGATFPAMTPRRPVSRPVRSRRR